MRRAWTTLACIGLAACADILGIDDGSPRDYDGSVDTGKLDGSVNDVLLIDTKSQDIFVEGAFSPLSCGSSTCNFAVGQGCCRTGASTYNCVDGGASSCSGTYIPCDRPEQCGSGDAGAEQCCTTDVLNDSGTYVASSVGCLAAAACQPIPAHYVLCGDDSGVECGDATSCAPSVATLPTFLICK